MEIYLSAAQIKSRDQEIERLKGELREATESLEATMAEEQVLYYTFFPNLNYLVAYKSFQRRKWPQT